MQRRTLIAGTLALPFLPPPVSADGAQAAGRWKPLAIPHRQVFPSLVIATATLDDRGAPADTLGDPHGVLGVEVTAAQAGERLRLTVRAPRLARESTLETVLPRAAVRYQVFPTMLWHFERLRAQRQAAPETVEFRLRLDDVALPMRALRVRVRSINEVPYFVPGPAGGIDLTWMFAAYVNEDHPLVARILREALALDGIERFDGYQSGDSEQVYRQLFAIWRVLRRRGIRYSSIVRTGAADARVLSQHVRFLEESWASNQANCVDGCVLIASVLRKIDLDPRLVLVPGHMFLAVDLDRGGQERAFIETTLLGEGDGRHEDTDAALANFEAAVARGFQRMQSASERIAARADPEYQLIDLAAARRLGIVPIAAA